MSENVNLKDAVKSNTSTGDTMQCSNFEGKRRKVMRCCDGRTASVEMVTRVRKAKLANYLRQKKRRTGVLEAIGVLFACWVPLRWGCLK